MTLLSDYVHQRGGARVISRILVANNGLAAVKGIRSLRRWCADTFNDSSVLTFVAMVTPEDINSNAEYISLANEVVEVGGEANYNNYANVDVIIECAKRARVHAVWAGWGHASENPELPRKLSQLMPPIQFIGPGSKAMRDLGDKIGSTVLAQSVGVPCVPWSGSGVTCDYSKEGITQEMCDRCCITNLEQARAAARKIGFPLMVKASEGGGGKGIRKVMCEEDLEAGFRQVTAEVSGCHVFLMKMATGMRHLEMQVLADEHGEAISLWGRDCSVQRRHQKILEEGPIVAATDSECREMEICAVKLAKAVGYNGAGTIEFLYGQGKFFFLEMNPRLQVEHPVSEMITGLNIPAVMLLIASGVPLNRITAVTDIFHPDSSGHLPPRPSISPLCHCIAARITAENADAGFRPNTGAVTQLKFRSSPDVWGYFSVMGSGCVHEYADSQIGHIFAHGKTREEARRSLILALKELVTRGEIRTTTEYLVWLCNQPRYVDASFDTQWLDGIIAQGPKARQEFLPVDTSELIVCAGVCHAQLTLKELRKEVVSSLKAGRTPMPNILSRQVDVSLVHTNKKFSLSIFETGPRSFAVEGPGASRNEVEFIQLPDSHILIFVNGKSHVCFGVREAQGFRLSISGMTVMFEDEVDPSRLLSSIPGKVARFVVDDGSHVAAGQQYAEIEVMKMYMPVYSSESGILRHFVREGAVVKAGDCVATLDLDDPSRVSKIVPATSVFAFDPPCPPPLGPMQRLRAAALRAKNIVDGYAVPGRKQEEAVGEVMAQLFKCAADPSLSVVAVREALAVSAAILPVNLVTEISDAIDTHLRKIGFDFESHSCKSESHELDSEFPAAEFLQRIAALPSSSRTAQLLQALEQHIRGWSTLLMCSFSELLASYAEVESKFAGRVDRKDIVVGELLGFDETAPGDSRDSDVGSRTGKSPRLVMEYLLSHERVRTKSFLVLAAVKTINENRTVFGLSEHADTSSTRLANSLTTISDFQGSLYTDCALACRQLYLKIDVPVHKVRMDRLAAAIQPEVERISKRDSNWTHAANGLDVIGSAGAEALELLIHSYPALEDELFEFFLPTQSTYVRVIAAELYIRRSHRVYQIEKLSCHTTQLPSLQSSITAVCVSWSFSNSNSLNSKPSTVNTPQASSSPLRGLGIRNPSMYFGISPTASDSGSSPLAATPLRYGRFVILPQWSTKAVTAALNELSPDFETNFQDNVVYFALPLGSEQHLGLVEQFSTLLKDSDAELRKQSVSRVTLMLVRDGAAPYFFTFSKSGGFNEDTLYRNVDRALAFQLEFSRMTHEYAVHVKPNSIRQTHTYWATNKHPSSGNSGRYFVRSVVLRGGGHLDSLVPSSSSSTRSILTLDSLGRANSSVLNEIDFALQDSLSALEEVMRKTPSNVKAFANHIFLNIIPKINMAVPVALDKIKNVIERCAKRLQDLHAEGVELAAIISDPKGRTHYIRLYSSVGIGMDVQVQPYKCCEIDGVFTLCDFEPEFNLTKGPLSGKPVDHPYLPLDSIPRKRLDARLQDTTYCYDIPALFENAVSIAWKRVADRISKALQPSAPYTSALELVPEFGHQDTVIGLKAVKDYSPGENRCGVVGWRIRMNTPECMSMIPSADGWAREIILIANDITFENGSFGPKESSTFKAMSELARALGIPRIYMAANSGARIGLSRDVMQTFRAKWCDDDDPTKGFEFLYLNAQDEAKMAEAGAVRTCKQDRKLKITSVIGEQHGIGVENLRGSGMIAGETSKSYLENFTLTFVSGHAVGIGAYLVRLGQRVIQKGPDGPPILLTGASALNKLLGRSVYLSNKQLGGVQIMHTNGVSHSIVADDSAGVEAMVEWLAFVPRNRTEQPPVFVLAPSDSALPTLIDSVERKVEWLPPVASPYDSRKLITGDGDINGSGEWLAGLVDRGSFVETLSAWAKTVVCGRARIGGIPVGLIAAQALTSTLIKPADPADLESRQQIVQQPGLVWFPDSAHKTAQAIRDFNHGEHLPIVVLANWRGFSGGMRDMFDEVLKFGALIVDALVQMKQPVFVLIPPHGELRGGAWVVIDPSINPLRMEMFADPTSRGGILEPTGTVEIKFRSPQLFETMKRLDPECARLEAEIREATSSTSSSELDVLKERLKQRQTKLLPVYQQIAVSFAALHDTPSRMLAKKCVDGIIPWADSRQFLYWRLRRRLHEDVIISRLAQAAPSMSEEALHKTVKSFVSAQVPACASSDESGSEHSVSDLIQFDRSIVAWLHSSQADVDKFIVQHRSDVVRATSKALAQENFASVVDGLADALEALEGHERSSAIIQLFTKLTGRERGVGTIMNPISPTLSHRLPPVSGSTPSRLDLNAQDAAADAASQQWSMAHVLRSMMDGAAAAAGGAAAAAVNTAAAAADVAKHGILSVGSSAVNVASSVAHAASGRKHGSQKQEE